MLIAEIIVSINVFVMNKTLAEIISTREDLSNYLFHFTKARNAKATLMSIINDSAIKDINHTGSICLTETPVTLLAPMFNLFNRYLDPMYAPYGIGIRKDVVYKSGGRPVIYGDEADKKKLPQALRWRFELYDPEKHDFTWLREWRLPMNYIELSFDNCFFIVDTKKDIEELWHLINTIDVDIDAQPEDGGIHTDYNVHLSRRYRMVSMEDIAKVCLLNKNELQKELMKQSEEDCIHGSSWE